MFFHPLERLVAKRRLGSRVKFWYHPAYAVPALTESFRAPNVEPRRGELVIGQLVEEKLLPPEQIERAPLASIESLLRFHGINYLEGTEDPEMLGRIFGLELGPGEVEPILLSARRAVGGTIAAATWAAKESGRVAINLGGGFHHAEPEQGSGFCVYNDIGVAIRELRADGYFGPVGIIDLDFHQGNGNLLGFADDPTVYCYSIHGSVWSHVECADKQILLSGRVGDRRYLAALSATLPGALQQHGGRLWFYIAGTDVLAGDRLGTYDLSLEGALERDRRVLDLLQDHGASAVVTLGGGYSSQAWWSSLALCRYALTGQKVLRAPKRASLRVTFDRIRRSLDPLELQKDEDDPFELTQADIDGALGPRPPARRILDYYSRSGVELGLERYGILAKVRERGYRDLEVEVEPQDPSHQMIRVRGRKPGGPLVVLTEVVLRRGILTDPRDPGRTFPVLSVEWLLLQDPASTFSLERPPLPGQTYPGLGIAREIGELFVQLCHRLSLAGILDQPAHYHNAAGSIGTFYFVDPKLEGRLLAMQAVLGDLPVDAASKMVEDGALSLADGTLVSWQPGPHVLPIDPGLVEYFASPEYRAQVAAEVARLSAAGLRVL
ncbi:MAG: histone deacetylase [Deltaproteobacteria bacterium]|nr:histone deacetylase [Deltaproteobacteria bacterium]